MKERQIRDQQELERVMAYDMDSDNNNTEQVSRDDGDSFGALLGGNSQKQDAMIAKTIIEGIPQNLEIKLKLSPLQEQHRFRVQTIFKSDLVKLCLMRCLRPDHIQHSLKSFVSKFLGSEFNESQPFEW
jgi:hypothetical protein